MKIEIKLFKIKNSYLNSTGKNVDKYSDRHSNTSSKAVYQFDAATVD